MPDIIQRREDLPANLDDLSRFVLVGREKLTAVRAEIRAIDKVGLAQEVREQKLKEAQDISEAVLDAEVRIGELMKLVPKATKGTGGNRYQSAPIRENDSAGDFSKSKSEVIREAGFSPKQVERFQTMADHPEIVEQVKAEAREKEEVVSRSKVLEKIKEQEHKPHVVNNSGNNEWYTPAKYIELAREVMGRIDLDPASCEHANKTVKAEQFFTAEDDGLAKEWHGKVWMNPPYSADLVQKFAEKIVKEYSDGHIEEAVILVNNATETGWFYCLASAATAVAFPKGRIRYESITHEMNSPLQGQAFLYFGNNGELFTEKFCSIGWVAVIT